MIVEKQPTSGKERCALARKFAEQFDMNLNGDNYEFVVDDPDIGEPFEKAYAPWPLRMYMLKGSKIEWIAEPKNTSYADASRELLQRLCLHSDAEHMDWNFP